MAGPRNLRVKIMELKVGFGGTRKIDANRGLRAGLVGTSAQITEPIRAHDEAGVDLLLL